MADLYMFLAQLQLVRLALSGQTVRLEGFLGAPNEPRTPSQFTWSRTAKRLRAILSGPDVEQRAREAGAAMTKVHGRRVDVLLAVGMVLLGLATFGALAGFIALCDRV
jgi:hypothetical protein